MQFDRERARLLADTMRGALAEGRWAPDRWIETHLLHLEQALSVSIQAGQPALEEMQAGLIGVHASDLMVHAQGALLDGSLRDPTLTEERLLSPSRLRLADVIDVRRPVGQTVDVSFLARRPAALAA
jgi:hypothetical protein